MTTLYTALLRLAKPDFRSPTWGPLINDDLDAIDAAITNALKAANIDVWINTNAYGIGDIAIDTVANPPTYWICSVAHTSPVSPTTFAASRAAHPTYWTALTFGVTPRGPWAQNTVYGYYDIAYDATLGIMALCTVPHTSPGTGTINSVGEKVNWVFIVDLPSVGTTAATTISFDNTTALLPGSPANVQTAIVALDTRVDNAATTVSGVITDLDAAEVTILSHTTTIASHTASISAHDTELADHESRLDTLEATVAALQAGFPATTAMLFWQAAAPTGWTKSVTHNDKGLRVVSGTGGGNGGSVAFSTVFGKTTTDATTLSNSTIPNHTHAIRPWTNPTGGSIPGFVATAATAGSVDFDGGATAATGSGGSHTHPIDIRVQYLDLIICTKN